MHTSPGTPRLLAAALLLLSTGCYHYRVTAPNPNPATEPRQKTVHNIAWGLLTNPQTVSPENCEPSNALDQVHVSSNLGYSLLTVLTLGFWAPVQVEWRCAKRQESGGVIGLQTPPPEEPRHAP